MLFRSFNNAATDKEESLICDWLAGNEENKKTYAKVRDLHEAFIMEAPIELLEGGLPGAARKRRRMLHTVLKGVGYAAALAIFCIAGYGIINNRIEARLSKTMNTIMVPAGKSMELVLSDGTTMWLNSGTEIEYPAVFSGKDRTVHLISGEAMFDVARDEDRPFNVETFASVISVLGTKFNVAVDSESGSFSAALLRGAVKVRSLLPGNDSEYLLRPNEMIRTDGDGFIMSRISDAGSVECWTKGLVDVAGVPFDELMRKFELLFDVDIIIERKEMPVVRYTWGKIRVSEGLDHALGVLSKASDFSWERNFETGSVIIR